MLLRPLTVEDLRALAFLNAPFAPRPERITGDVWLGGLGGANVRCGGGWAVVDARKASLAGLVIYHEVQAREAAAIISYGLEAFARGRGLGTAAVMAAATKLMTELGFETLFADVEIGNVASQRLLHKVGFDPLTPYATPGIEVAASVPGQRWRMGLPQFTAGRSIIDLGSFCVAG